MTVEDLNSVKGCLMQLDMLKGYMRYWIESRVEYELKCKEKITEEEREIRFNFLVSSGEVSRLTKAPVKVEGVYIPPKPFSFSFIVNKVRSWDCKSVRQFFEKMRECKVKM